MNTKQVKGFLMTMAGAACWGVSGCFGQYLFLEKDMTAEWLVVVRLVVAGILLVAIGFLKEKKKMFEVFQNKKDTKTLLVFSFFGMMMCQYSYFAAVKHANAGTATVIQALNAVAVLTYVCVKGRRKPNKMEVLAICIALVGIFLLSTGGDIHNMPLTTVALGFGLISAGCVAVYNIISGEIMKKYGVYAIVGYGMLIGGLIMLPFARPWNESYPVDMGLAIALFGVVIVGTAVAFSLFLKGISIVGPFVGSLMSGFESVIAVGGSVLFLGSAFSVVELVGVVLILSTVYLLTINSAKQR
ncbi:DMT family transporter [Chakrabartyella piscis]|uniref:DMT family transporter n=1 Tax=Chakrabartyella piscis TaxID=2918914 RepID=UPI0029589FDC|nr:EamA family transporter [Chakrabartyella piscis]